MARFLVPKIDGKTKHTDTQKHQRNDQFWDRFFIDFGSVLGGNLEPCWLPFSAQDGPRGLQDNLKTPPRRSQDVSKMISGPKHGYPIGPSRGTPSAQVVLASFLDHFGSQIDPQIMNLFDVFWVIFEWDLIVFPMILIWVLRQVCLDFSSKFSSDQARWRARRSAALWRCYS